MEKMRYSIMQKIGSCINDSQWKIGAFLTNSYANPKKFRSRKKKIYFGLNQQPDCVVIPNPDRKSSVILEANRSQIPIASLADSTITWEFYKRITYPIPANDTIQFIYLFLNSITKTVILERPRARVKVHRGLRCYASSSDPKGGNRSKGGSTFFSTYFMGLMRSINPELLKSIFLFLVRRLADACLPGGALLVGILCSLSSPAKAAGPSDWMSGDPEKKLLRRTEKQILKINEELDNVTSQAVANAQLFQLNFPGTNREQADSIRSILEHDLDGVDLNQRLRRIRKWLKPGEVGNPESLFWVQVIDQISKFFP